MTTRPDPPAAPAPKDCIACGRCMDVCPLFTATQREELSPKATHQLMMQLRAGSTEIRARQAEQLAAMCLGCDRCVAACPQGLDAAAVAGAIRASHPDWRGWLWQRWITHAGLLWPTLASLSKAAPGLLPHALDSTRGLQLPPTRPWLRVREWDFWGRGKEVAIFPGCTATHLRPQWVARTRWLLEHCGFRVVKAKGFGCCGATLGHAGLHEAQREVQRKNVLAWRKAGRPVMVSFCASCRAGLLGYGDGGEEPAVLCKDWDVMEARRFVEAVQPLSPFLRNTQFVVDAERAPGQVVWHQPCHARENNADGAFLKTALGDLLTRQVTDRCCGLGGVMQLAASDLPRRVAAACWEALLPAGTVAPEQETQVLTGCSGCTVQLGATRPESLSTALSAAAGQVSVFHWLDILES